MDANSNVNATNPQGGKDVPSRSAYRATLALSVLLGLGILVLVNYIGGRRYARFDWTTTGRYSLSDKTLNVLKDLKTPVTVTVFMTPERTAFYSEVDELLKRYKAKSPMLTVEILDPTRNLARAKTFVEETGVRNFAVVFRAGEKQNEKKKVVTEDRIVEFDYTRGRMGGDPSVKSFRGEQEFTSAILAVTQGKAPRVLFTSGHGERAFDAPRSGEGFSEVAESLKADNCTVEAWASLGAAAVPEGADLVVVAGPRSPFTESEGDALKKYVEAGGRVLLFLDVEFLPGASRTLSDFGLSPLLSSVGLTLDSDIVVDPKNALPMMGAETVFAKSYRAHPVTKLLTGLPVVFPLSRSVSVAKPAATGWKATPLVETSADGWGETNLKELEKSGQPKKDDKDVSGPVSLAVAVESDEPSGAPIEGGAQPVVAPKRGGRAVVFGDADWASNAGIANGGNGRLLSSAANWALERESLVAIPPKAADQVAVTLTRRDIGQLALVVMLLLPLASIAMGIAIWARRRK